MLAYTITFTVGRYYVCPMGGAPAPGVTIIPGIAPPVTPTYWAIVDEATRDPVAFAFDENQAQVICFSLMLVLSRINGDRAQERALSRMLDSLTG